MQLVPIHGYAGRPRGSRLRACRASPETGLQVGKAAASQSSQWDTTHSSFAPRHCRGTRSQGEKMIEVENLSKRYGDKLAVDGLDFVVRPGVVTGFLGPNGAGKATTIRLVAGRVEPKWCSVRVNGK